jgi:hypothetical protein
MLVAAIGWGALLAPGLAAAFALGRDRRSPLSAAVLFLVVVAVLGSTIGRIEWLEAARPLPLFMSVLVGVSLAGFVRRRREPEAFTLALRTAVAVFALTLLLRVVLNVHVSHYGFALAMPAALLVVVALLEWIPAAIDRAGGYGAAFRAGALGVLTVGVFAHLEPTSRFLGAKVHVLGRGADAFHTDGRGQVLQLATDDIARRLRADQTLVAFPEGSMLNYLARRANPTPHSYFVPFAVLRDGEDRMLESLARQPPDMVALVHLNTAEEGARFFGQDYGRQLNAWIVANYREVRQVGARPFTGRGFGIVLMERRPHEAS